MRFYSAQECKNWLRGRERQLPDVAPASTIQFPFPTNPGGILQATKWIASHLTCGQPTLLWITEWGIWPSSENWHLYYKLRQTYDDHRLLEEAPGHLLFGHETEDLVSFLEISLLNGWGGYVLTQANYVNAFFSHNEYFCFYAADEDKLTEIPKAFPAI